MANHFVLRCKHGELMGQCRCPAPNKTVRVMACPGSHDEWTTDEHPIIYPEAPEVPEALVESVKPEEESDSDLAAATAFLRRTVPLISEPMRTKVAEEWAKQLIADGWHR